MKSLFIFSIIFSIGFIIYPFIWILILKIFQISKYQWAKEVQDINILLPYSHLKEDFIKSNTLLKQLKLVD